MFSALCVLSLPFLGTAAGASSVFFLKSNTSCRAEHTLSAFASGIMVAASVWSLLLPALDLSRDLGCFRILPALCGLFLGFFFFIIVDGLLSRRKPEKRSLLLLAVNLHNLPEGMAVGAVYAGVLAGLPGMSLSSALAVSAGIAIQNIPEGAIVSMPLHSRGKSRGQAFLQGLLSAAIEPLGAVLTLAAYQSMSQALPYLLSFAAGAMLFVVIRELIPHMNESERPNFTALFFSLGFALMMTLDVCFGS